MAGQNDRNVLGEERINTSLLYLTSGVDVPIADWLFGAYMGEIFGVVNITLLPSVLTSAGAVSVSGMSDKTLLAATLASAGAAAIIGQAAASLVAAGVSGIGSVAIQGQAAPSLSAAVLDGAGSVALAGQVNVELQPVMTESAGAVAITGQSDSSLAASLLESAVTVALLVAVMAMLQGVILTAEGTTGGGEPEPPVVYKSMVLKRGGFTIVLYKTH